MNVLITGCSRGIGNAMLLLLINNPKVKKVFALSSNASSLDQHSKLIPINVDFLEEGWQEKVISIVKKDSINVLINNAGYLYNGPISSISQVEVQKMFNINVNSPLLIVQGLLENLKSGQAHIVNIGSMGGFSGSSKFPGLSFYSSSKAALANLSECWAEELKEFNIKSNCLALGAVNTEMLNEAFPGYQAPVNSKEIAEKIIDFSLNYSNVINGKIIPLSVSTP